VLAQKGLIGEELRGPEAAGTRSPAAAVLLLIFMLSLAGIPADGRLLYGKYFIFFR